MKEFGLTPEQSRIMFSDRYHLVQADIDNESDYFKKSLSGKETGFFAEFVGKTEVFWKKPGFWLPASSGRK
jgi:hypothetical protein